MSVQSTAGSRGVRISFSNAGYTTFRGGVRVLATHSIRQFPLHFPTRASPCATRFRTSSTSSKCHIRTAEKFDDWTEVVCCHDAATQMRCADKWFVDDENHSHMRVDIWIVIKKKKLLLHSVPAVGSPAVQQTRCFLLMTLYILCMLPGVCKSCKHTSSYRRHGTCNFSNPATWLLEHRKRLSLL